MDSRANDDKLRMNNNKTTINKSLTMKKLAFFLVMLAAVAVGQAQTTGTGIVLLTGSPYEFTPTTVDSTTTFEFQLVNTVGVQQIVYFGGLDAPFNVNPLIPTAVPANDTLDMELTSTPARLGCSAIRWKCWVTYLETPTSSFRVRASRSYWNGPRKNWRSILPPLANSPVHVDHHEQRRRSGNHHGCGVQQRHLQFR